MKKLAKVEMNAVDSQQLYARILTPENAAEVTMVSADRLVTLANSGYAPALWIDGDGPFFKAQEIIKFVKEHLVLIQSSRPLNLDLKVILAENAAPADVPLVLSQMTGVLKVYPWREAASAVYFLLKGEEVVYVGQSRNLANRLITHSLEKDFNRVFYIPVPSESLNEVESALIRALQPKLNEAAKSPIRELDIKTIEHYCYPRISRLQEVENLSKLEA